MEDNEVGRTIAFSILTNPEQVQCHTEILTLADNSDPVAMDVKPQVNAYHEAFEQEDDAYKKIVASVFTEAIHEIDQERDLYFSGLNDVIKASSKHPSPAKKESSKRLKVAVKTAGKVSKLPMNQKTAVLTNLIQELRGRFAPDVDEIGAGDFVDNLEHSNNEFQRLVDDRNNETALKSQIVMKEARQKVDAAYKKLIKRIEAIIVLNNSNIHKDFMLRHNIIIKKYKDLYALRIGMKKKK